MKRKAYQVVFRATLVVMMVAFLSTIFFVNADPSFAAAAKKKSSTVVKTSAVEYTEAQIKQLQGDLGITKDQETLFANLTQVMRDNAKEMDAFFTKARAENAKNMNAVERMKFQSEITETQSAQLNRLIPPFELFYASLSGEQKKSTDTIFRTGKYGTHKRK